MEPTKLMDVEAVSAYVGLTAFTIRKLAREGKIPAAKIGRAYRFKRDDIDSYLREQYKTMMENANAN